MALLPILIAPDKCLKTVAKPIAAIDAAVRRLADDMLETMYEAPGIGLAAPQVGRLLRIIVMDLAEKNEPPAPLILINPEILWSADERAVFNEGCLSLPEIYADIERPSRVRFKYRDMEDRTHEREADGLLATCVQHEIDHLNGVLFVDYLSPVKRSMILRKLEKQKKRGEFDE